MSGFFGILRSDGQEISRDLMERIIKVLRDARENLIRELVRSGAQISNSSTSDLLRLSFSPIEED